MNVEKLKAWASSHQVRLTFEQVALAVIVFVVLLGCLIGFYSDALAARVVQLKEAIKDFLSLLSLTVGASWTRGHMDNRINPPDGDKHE